MPLCRCRVGLYRNVKMSQETLEALEVCLKSGALCVGVTNVVGSEISRREAGFSENLTVIKYLIFPKCYFS